MTQDRTCPRMTDLLPRAGEGIVLRRLAATDLAVFQSYRQDPDIGRYQGWVATPDEQARDFLIHMNQATLLQPGSWCQIGIAENDDLALIGDIGLILASDSSRAEIGFTLCRAFQGRGLATAAVKAAIALVFENTSAGKVVGIADTRNLSSIRLLERVGMHKVGVRRARCQGEPCTELVHEVYRPRAAEELTLDPPASKPVGDRFQ
ncbi:MAG: N-acetyltransferase [Alphaproteobacteria bacterium]|nr:MAG: N-acetyltransferase [Alphaproteobacteria bacterium]